MKWRKTTTSQRDGHNEEGQMKRRKEAKKSYTDMGLGYLKL